MGIGTLETRRYDRPANDTTSPVYRLFVASPGDLKGERDAVEEVVAELNRSEPGVRLEVIRWEDFSAPHWERPQEAVFLNTQFERTDLFIALFWRRMGTPSGKRDPSTNEPYLSGTVEELTAAVQRYKDGSLRRIMVYFCTRRKKLTTHEEERQWKSVQAFRKKLDEEKSVLYKEFTTTDRFKLRLRSDLDLVVKTLRQESQTGALGVVASLPAPTPAPVADVAIGDDVPRMCNRDEHDYQFYTAFSEGIDQRPGAPQVYLIYGDERQGLDSLSIRFATTIRKRIVASGPAASRVVSVPEHRVQWPGSETGTLKPEEYRTRLATSLIRQLDARSELRQTTAEALVSLDAFHRTPCVIIHHDVSLSGWSSATSALVEWYLNDYWAALRPDGARATIVVFVKLSCPPTMSAAPRIKLLGGATSGIAELRTALDRIVAVSRQGCRRHVVDELRSVTRPDVNAWFVTYGIYRSEQERIDETNRLFGVGTPNETDSLPMAVVEKRLMQIHESITRSTGERAS